jgi:hypothetical protein
MSRTTDIVVERDGTNGNGDTVSPSSNHRGGAETVELHMISRIMVVVIATAAHRAL